MLAHQAELSVSWPYPNLCLVPIKAVKQKRNQVTGGNLSLVMKCFLQIRAVKLQRHLGAD